MRGGPQSALCVWRLLVAAAGLAAWMYFFVVPAGPARPTTPPPMSRSRPRSDGTVALLSYSPESLDKDFATAKSKLTGGFLSYYTQFTEQIVTPAAKQKSVKTAGVGRAGRGVGNSSGLGGGAGVHQPDHRKQGPARRSFINSAVRVT